MSQQRPATPSASAATPSDTTSAQTSATASTHEPADESALGSLGRAASSIVGDAAAGSQREQQLDAASQDPSLEAIYRELQHGRGREHVTDANVEGLIGLARERGDAQLELLLREWRSPCGDDPDAPDPASLQRLPPA